VFNAKVPHRPRISYTGSVKSNILHLDAGTAHGITVGSKMLIWKDLESYYLLEDNPTAEVSLYNVNLYNSTARAPQILLHGSSVVAQHVLSGDRPELRIHVRDEASSRMVHDAVTREPVDNVIKPMNIVPSPIETASVVISTAREGIYFDFLDPEINRHGLKRLPHTTRANVIDLQRTIHAISHHLYHLRFPKIPVDEEAAFFASKVSIEVFKAKVYLDDPPSIVGDNLNVNGKGIDLEMDGSPQVIVIKNDSEFDIYPALFYFECIDLSISQSYSSRVS
jgi:hypothetical protein